MRVWNSSQPDWLADFERAPSYVKDSSGPIGSAADNGKTHLDETERKLKQIETVFGERKIGRRAQSNHLMHFFASEPSAPSVSDRPVATYLDVIRSAMTVLGFSSLRPLVSVTYVAGTTYVLSSHDVDGNPAFTSLRQSALGFLDLSRAFNDVHNYGFNLPLFWRINALAGHLSGLTIETYEGDGESDHAESSRDSLAYLSAVVADMAVHGIRSATVRNTFLGLYRTAPCRWDVDIEGVREPGEGQGKTDVRDRRRWPMDGRSPTTLPSRARA